MLNKIANGLLGNFSEKDAEDLNQKYQDYLFDNEEVQMGYQLIRDTLLFTNHRIIFIDKQGASGKKMSFKSIHLDTIVDVEMETSGLGIDDSEITITYLNNVYQQSNNESMSHVKFEFPKKTDITPLYRHLGNISLENRQRINS